MINKSQFHFVVALSHYILSVLSTSVEVHRIEQCCNDELVHAGLSFERLLIWSHLSAASSLQPNYFMLLSLSGR